jgi:N6-adenosine-specific RNA methylase IME4
MDRAPENHYATTPLEGIMNLDVPGACAPDCVLFLWATVPMLPQALAVMDVWGFAYKSHLAWVKDKIGTGFWARNKHELLLIGTKGEIPAPAMGTQPDSAIAAAVGDHSRKPVIFHEIIEGMFPNLAKLEMISRQTREGWDSWGNEVGLLDEEAA